jgi:hypothetical protein
MIDIHSPARPLTINLPADLVRELQEMAAVRQVTLDEVVREACLAYSEPHIWERCYQDWLRVHPDQPKERSASAEKEGPA